MIELLCASAAHHSLLTGAQREAQDVLNRCGHLTRRYDSSRATQLGAGVHPDAHTSCPLVDVSVVCLFKEVQSAAAP